MLAMATRSGTRQSAEERREEVLAAATHEFAQRGYHAASTAAIAERAGRGEAFWGYSLNAHGRIIVTELIAPRCVGRDKLIEITLDTGERIEATFSRRSVVMSS